MIEQSTTTNVNEYDNTILVWPSNSASGGYDFQLKLTKESEGVYNFRGCTFSKNSDGYYVGTESDGSQVSPMISLLFNILAFGRIKPEDKQSKDVYATHLKVASAVDANQKLLEYFITDMVKVQDLRVKALSEILASKAYQAKTTPALLSKKYEMAAYYVTRGNDLDTIGYLNYGQHALVASKLYLSYINYDKDKTPAIDLIKGYTPEHYSDMTFERTFTSAEVDYYVDLVTSVATGWTWNIIPNVI